MKEHFLHFLKNKTAPNVFFRVQKSSKKGPSHEETKKKKYYR